jgi:Holliday junction resolvase-like predicted endonuclease
MVFGLKANKISRNLMLVKEDLFFEKEFDAENYVLNKLQNLGVDIQRSKRAKNIGVLDFFCIDSTKGRFYVEVKSNEDGLRFEQLLWISKNPQEKVIIYYLKPTFKKPSFRQNQSKKRLCNYCNTFKDSSTIIKTTEKKNICYECRKKSNEV